ncbi:M15 family metallopeptidase [Demequina sp.]|uniref:M15 family metallopeptidase n=1 Tax=Demequina sp. TaxID=2050685 RepID=UPI003A8417CB
MDAIAAISQRISNLESLLAGSTSPVWATSSGVVPLGGLAGSTATATTTATAATSFDAILTSAIGADSTASSTGLNADGVPRDLAAYGNGQIPEAALQAVPGTSERLWAPAATQLTRLLDDARAAGVTIGVTDGYRDYASQVALAQSKGLYSQGGLAAEPGTSQHGWGLAVDLALDSTAQAWMRDNAGRYGFVENVAREPWHWEYVP